MATNTKDLVHLDNRTVQYIDFTTRPGYATIWDSRDGAPADAVPVRVSDLYALAHDLR